MVFSKQKQKRTENYIYICGGGNIFHSSNE